MPKDGATRIKYPLPKVFIARASASCVESVDVHYTLCDEAESLVHGEH